MGREGFSGNPGRVQALRLRREMRERPPRERRREEVAVAGSGTAEMVNEVEAARSLSWSGPSDVGTGELNAKGIPEYVAGVERSGETGGIYNNMLLVSQLARASPKTNP